MECMILKKYKIGPVGNLKATYRRVKLQDVTSQDYICTNLCGVGQEKCRASIIYADAGENRFKDLSYYTLCYALGLLKRFKTKNNIAYIPWKIR